MTIYQNRIMKTKEEIWLSKRLGMITASELGSITSQSGKIIDGVVSYIRSKRFERVHGYSLPVSSRAMEIGKETEPMIFEWIKANCPEGEDPSTFIYSRDLEEIPFWRAPDTPLGASPDAFTKDEHLVFEFKTLVGNENTEFFCDKYTSYAEKTYRVVKEHIDQITGLFISNPKVQRIILVKYAPQRDDIMDDRDSPLAPWRGISFIFDRDAYPKWIEEMKERINLIDAMIDSDINPSEFKVGVWSLSNGGLVKTNPESKKK